MTKDFYHFIGVPTILGAFFIVLYIAYLALYPFQTIVPRTQPYKILSPVVEVGQPVIYEADVCKITNAPAVVTRQIVSADGIVTSLPSVTSNLPAGCQKSAVATTIIPPGMQPGVYHLQLSVVYTVNIFQTISVRLTTQDFTIVASQ